MTLQFGMPKAKSQPDSTLQWTLSLGFLWYPHGFLPLQGFSTRPSLAIPTETATFHPTPPCLVPCFVFPPSFYWCLAYHTFFSFVVFIVSHPYKNVSWRQGFLPIFFSVVALRSQQCLVLNKYLNEWMNARMATLQSKLWAQCLQQLGGHRERAVFFRAWGLHITFQGGKIGTVCQGWAWRWAQDKRRYWSQRHHLPAAWPWARHLTSLSCSSFLGEMRTLTYHC